MHTKELSAGIGTRIRMASRVVRFTRGQWLPIIRDRKEYVLDYSIADAQLIGKPEEAARTQTGKIVVGVSRTLEAMWRLSTENLERVLFEYAKRHMEGKVLDHTLGEYEEIQLSSYNAPSKCPYDPAEIYASFESAFEFPEAEQSFANRTMTQDVPSQIIDLRDNTNALFGEMFHGRLLSLPQERSLLELFRPCNSQEEFAYRVASLSTLVTSVDTSSIKAHLRAAKGKKSLDILGEFLRSRLPGPRVNQLMDSFQAFNHLRRMYPIHTDRASGVIEAHSYFGLEYPVEDYQAAWQTLMKAYAESLRALLDLLKSLK